MMLGVNFQHLPHGDHESPLPGVVGEEESHCIGNGDGDDLVLRLEKFDHLKSIVF